MSMARTIHHIPLLPYPRNLHSIRSGAIRDLPPPSLSHFKTPPTPHLTKPIVISPLSLALALSLAFPLPLPLEH
jgi:hypothetical protein